MFSSAAWPHGQKPASGSSVGSTLEGNGAGKFVVPPSQRAVASNAGRRGTSAIGTNKGKIKPTRLRERSKATKEIDDPVRQPEMVILTCVESAPAALAAVFCTPGSPQGQLIAAKPRALPVAVASRASWHSLRSRMSGRRSCLSLSKNRIGRHRKVVRSTSLAVHARLHQENAANNITIIQRGTSFWVSA